MASSQGPNLEDVRRIVGGLVRARRRTLGLTQGELAERCETDTSQISALETGKRRFSLDWLVVVARALDCAVADLLPEDERGAQMDGDEADLVAVFRGLSEGGRQHFMNLAKAYALPVNPGAEPFARGPGELTFTVRNFTDMGLKAAS